MDIGLQRRHEKGVDGSVEECADNGDGDGEHPVQFQRAKDDAEHNVAGDDDAEEDTPFEPIRESTGDEAKEEERGETGSLSGPNQERGV